MKIVPLSVFALVATLTAVMTAAPRSTAQEQVPADPAKLTDLMAIGEPIFAARCKECHGTAGGGFIGPKFVGNSRIGNAELVLRQINGGSADMPAFRNKLTPEEVLAVGTYIRNSWGNAYGVLTE